MKKAFVLIALFVPFCFFLSACQGYREIDGEYLISAIAFSGEAEGYKVYAEVLEVAAEDKDTKNELFSAGGKTPYEAVEEITGKLPKKAVFDHCGTAIIGSNTSGEDFTGIIEYLYDAKNLNLGICLYCADNIEEILSLKPKTMSIGYDIMAVKNNLEKTTGIPFKNKYYEVCGFQMAKKGFCLPNVTAGKSGAQISAETVYIDFAPVFYLNKDEAAIFNLLLYGSGGGEISAGGKKCRYNKISTKATAGKINIKIKYRSRKHRATAELKREAEDLIGRLSGTPAYSLISPYFTVNGQVKVEVYEKQN